MAHPDQRNNALLWQPLPAALPDLTNPAFARALSVTNWAYPYAGMDMPTPQPAHLVQPPANVP